MKIFFVSLGCDKNLVDSEKMLGVLADRGFQITNEAEVADVIVINTCAFILDAKKESIETIIEMEDYRKNGGCKALIVTGCLAERYSEEIQEEFPSVDGIIGTSEYDKIGDVVDHALKSQKDVKIGNLSYLPKHMIRRVRSGVPYFSYLKISEGCNKNCTYCAIPSMRGRYRSTEMEDLLEESRILVQDGVKELILVAQETTLYGKDLYGKKMLPELIKRLCEMKELSWIRLMYCYPEEITEELVQVMADEPKVCNYLDLPIQHCNDRILKAMGRKTDKKELVDKIAMIRSYLPDVALRTTLISGFPGEQEEDYEECRAFIQDISFDRLGVFPYSPEEGTKAARMPDQVEEEIKIRRANGLMEAEKELLGKKNQTRIGKIYPVLVEGYLPSDEIYVGRSYMDAPDVDGNVFFKADPGLISGDLVHVEVEKATEYDWMGRRV